MNIQEVIEELMSKSREVTFGDDDNVYLSRNRTIELISQIDEPKKIVVPKFVAEWIEEKKKSGIDLHKSMAYEVKADVFRYIMDNSETYARAWLDGYEVEQEKRYRITIKNACHGALGFNSIQKHYSFYIRLVKADGIRYEHTKEELEQAGFGWVFDCEGVKVEEVK